MITSDKRVSKSGLGSQTELCSTAPNALQWSAVRSRPLSPFTPCRTQDYLLCPIVFWLAYLQRVTSVLVLWLSGSFHRQNHARVLSRVRKLWYSFFVNSRRWAQYEAQKTADGLRESLFVGRAHQAHKRSEKKYEALAARLGGVAGFVNVGNPEVREAFHQGYAEILKERDNALRALLRERAVLARCVLAKYKSLAESWAKAVTRTLCVVALGFWKSVQNTAPQHQPLDERPQASPNSPNASI